MDEQERKIYTGIIIAVIVLGSIISYFIFSVVKHQKRGLAIQKENAFAQITLLEKDRSRIAEDLHDELAPMLSAVKMNINSFELSFKNDQEQLEKTNRVITDLAKKMREISFDLMPATLQRKGVLPALQEFISYISNSSDLNIRLLLPKEDLFLDEHQQLNIYRIIQEILHNTIKHAEANEFIMGFKKEQKRLVITATDNGIGFNHNEKFTGLGYRSILNRVNLLNADINIRSNKEEGTKYTIKIPLKT